MTVLHILVGMVWIGLLIYFNERLSKFYGQFDQSDGVAGLINIIWCDIDSNGKYYALAEDWNTGIKVCRYGKSPKQAQDNARKELKRILNDATLEA